MINVLQGIKKACWLADIVVNKADGKICARLAAGSCRSIDLSSAKHCGAHRCSPCESAVEWQGTGRAVSSVIARCSGAGGLTSVGDQQVDWTWQLVRDAVLIGCGTNPTVCKVRPSNPRRRTDPRPWRP